MHLVWTAYAIHTSRIPLGTGFRPICAYLRNPHLAYSARYGLSPYLCLPTQSTPRTSYGLLTQSTPRAFRSVRAFALFVPAYAIHLAYSARYGLSPYMSKSITGFVQASLRQLVIDFDMHCSMLTIHYNHFLEKYQ